MAPRNPSRATEARKLREKRKKMRSNGVALALNQSSVSGRHRLLAASKKTNDRTAPTPEAAMSTPKPLEDVFSENGQKALVVPTKVLGAYAASVLDNIKVSLYVGQSLFYVLEPIRSDWTGRGVWHSHRQQLDTENQQSHPVKRPAAADINPS
ncbi:MAG: hypothetical protein ACM37Z_07980 [Deltaproteobacteria bacterium]